MEDNTIEKIDDLTAQMRLARLINDSGTTINVAGERMTIRGIKPGVAYLVAEEATKIMKIKSGDMVDVFKQMVACEPAIIRILALCILNDKDRIFSDYRRREYSDEFYALEDKLEWESSREEWVTVLAAVMDLIDLRFFFQITEMTDNFRTMMMAKKTPIQKSSTESPLGET